MILNHLALGLNQTLSGVINNFDMIYHMIEKSNGKMNIHSLLDVIDASKVLLYDLKPDELDIPLATIAKIQNSRQHCIESSSTIIKKAKKLHHERKRKVSSSIPIVKGKFQNEITYEVLGFDDEKLLTVGIDTGSCFKIGAPGEDFLKYCLTNKNGAVLTFVTKDGTYYACPIIRNGNSIFGNGIDPKPATYEEMENIIGALKAAFEKICLKSSSEEPIEMGVITDLHLKDYFLKNMKERFEVEKPFMIGEYCYTDYYKPEINNYVLYKVNEKVKMSYYNPVVMYEQPRSEPFFYISSIEKDKEKVELIINSIGYALYKNDKKTQQKKVRYKPFCVEDFSSIIGNKDWFVGIRKNLQIESYCLPYDIRAKKEMYRILAQTQDNVEFLDNVEDVKRCKNIKA